MLHTAFKQFEYPNFVMVYNECYGSSKHLNQTFVVVFFLLFIECYGIENGF